MFHPEVQLIGLQIRVIHGERSMCLLLNKEQSFTVGPRYEMFIPEERKWGQMGKE